MILLLYCQKENFCLALIIRSDNVMHSIKATFLDFQKHICIYKNFKAKLKKAFVYVQRSFTL